MGGVWMIAAVDRVMPHRNKSGIAIQNKYQELAAEDEDVTVEICGLDSVRKLTRPSAIEFNVADVRKPLASAVKMVKSQNRVILDEDGSYIQNKETGECMEVWIENETFVFDVDFENGKVGAITLDSGAGVNVWPKNKMKEVPMQAKRPWLKMGAANGSEIRSREGRSGGMGHRSACSGPWVGAS